MTKFLKIKGDEWEMKASVYYHSKNIGVLVSPDFLRSYGAGQIDICIFNKRSDCLEIIECKNGGIISKNQRKRLRYSANLLSSIFDKSITLKICQKKSN